MARRLALAGIITTVAPDGSARVLDYRTDLVRPDGAATSGLVYEDLDRPGLSIADELDGAFIRARAGEAHQRSARRG